MVNSMSYVEVYNDTTQATTSTINWLIDIEL